ncbi:hypothetical protein ACPA9J_32215 [Pseudomonas aeruginosa]
MNDERSAKIYDSYLKMLDPARVFTSPPATSPSSIARRTQVRRLPQDGNLDPGFVIYKRHLDRLKGRLDYALAMLNKGVDKIDFSVDESPAIDRERGPLGEGHRRRSTTSGARR